MMNQFDAAPEAKPGLTAVKLAWVKPTLERLSLKDALSGGSKAQDGYTAGPDQRTTFS
jgi:hypothetical protein